MLLYGLLQITVVNASDLYRGIGLSRSLDDVAKIPIVKRPGMHASSSVAHGLQLSQGVIDGGVFESGNYTVDMQEARLALNMSQISYCPAEYQNAWNSSLCQSTMPDFKSNYIVGTYYHTAAIYGVSHEKKLITVAFRGTRETDLWNWITDVDYLSTTYPYVNTTRVHRGFFKAYEFSFKDTLAVHIPLLMAANPTYKLMVTGHSMGGALATLCVAHFSSALAIKADRLITFGAPRVGNVDFSNWFQTLNISSSRFTHGRDIVPHLPLNVYDYLRFRHIPREIWQPSGAKANVQHICNGSGEDSTCSDSLYFSLSIADHINYLGSPIGTIMCYLPFGYQS
eukprot:CFRG6195T1